MSEILKVVSDLRERGVHIWAEGDHLRYRLNSGSLNPDEIAQLRMHKAAIISYITKGSPQDASGALPIVRAVRNGPVPLSYPQQRLWFLCQIQGVSEAYHIPLALRLRGLLDERSLRNALNRLSERHKI